MIKYFEFIHHHFWWTIMFYPLPSMSHFNKWFPTLDCAQTFHPTFEFDVLLTNWLVRLAQARLQQISNEKHHFCTTSQWYFAWNKDGGHWKVTHTAYFWQFSQILHGFLDTCLSFSSDTIKCWRINSIVDSGFFLKTLIQAFANLWPHQGMTML